MRRGAFCTAFVLALALNGLRSAEACAPAPREGEVVRIADEEALIVWDEKSKTQHFVRRASFVSSADAFGFLVPTPSKPELGEVDSELFSRLAQLLVPRVVYERGELEVEPGCTAFWMLARSARESAPATAAAGGVRVLGEQRVAGFDAVVLAADDPAALSAWLKERSFAEGPTLTEWLRPYVEKKWIITAFKIADTAGPAASRSIGTSSVRMSFSTDKPFYPYREPADQRDTVPAAHKDLPQRPRTLRVYFASDARVDGALGNGAAFPGAVKLADTVDMPAQPTAPFLPARGFLTVFEDTSNPRPGVEDVFFSPAKDPSVVTIPPVVIRQPVRVPLPLDLLVVLVGGVAAVALAIRRRHRRAH
jgi:hypothetical protein